MTRAHFAVVSARVHHIPLLPRAHLVRMGLLDPHSARCTICGAYLEPPDLTRGAPEEPNSFSPSPTGSVDAAT